MLASRGVARLALDVHADTELLGQRALWWPQRRWLVIADAHFGKAATFRALGVPVPEGTTGDNLTRLETLVAQLRPGAVVFLGDLFHARQAHASATVQALRDWRERHAELELILIEGNHDRAAGPPPAMLGIRCESEPFCVDRFAFCHQPQRVNGATALAGHLHPAVTLHGRAGDSLKLPCFWIRDGLVVLPAFGSFTGSAVIRREEGDRVVAVAEDRLFAMPARSPA
jgi:DNA ligase-associated metallophosphoesterase